MKIFMFFTLLNLIITETAIYNFERPQFISRKRNMISYERSAHLINNFFKEKRDVLQEKKSKINYLMTDMSEDDKKILKEDINIFNNFYEKFNEFYEQSLVYFRKMTVHKKYQFNMRSAFETYKDFLNEQFNSEEMKRLKRNGETSYCKIVTYF